MTDNETNKMLEDSPGIEVADAKIPKFNLVVFAVITIICVVYLFTNFTR